MVTSELPVPAYTSAGAKVRVWTTRDGQLTSPPMSESQVAYLAELGEIAGAAAVAVLLALVGVAGPSVARQAQDGRLGRRLAVDRTALDDPRLAEGEP